MNLKDCVTGFFITFPIVFIVSLVVSYLYSLLVHGTGELAWDSAFQFGIIFGIVLPIMRQFEKKRGPE